MTLTVKQRAKINAALCLIHDNGHNADAVSGVARDLMRSGVHAKAAFERALNGFVDRFPDLLPPLARVVGLVEASDDATVAQYDAALSGYIATGDDSAVRALAPMIAQDMATLAERNGDPLPDDMAANLQAAAAEAPKLEPIRNTFAFTAHNPAAPETVAGRPIVGHGRDGPIVRTASQVSISSSATRMVAPKARAAWENTPYVGPLSVTSAPHGLTPNSAREATGAAAMNGGRAIVSSDGQRA